MEQDIKDFVQDWNTHPIRSNHNVASPCGRPDDMYEVPEMFGMRACNLYNNIIAINNYLYVVQELWTRCTLLILRCGLGGCWSHPENHSCVPTSLKSLRQSYYYHLAFDTRIFQNLTVEMCTFNFPKFSQIINKIIS